MTELKAIKALITALPTQRNSGYAAPAQSASNAATPEGPPPQPHHLVDNPGDVHVHFGKNNGTPLSALSERSLSWYATEQPPRLDSLGKPYPPRAQEVALRNAARQLWHIQKGSLAGGAEANSGTTTVMNDGHRTPPAARPPAAGSDEEVPF